MKVYPSRIGWGLIIPIYVLLIGIGIVMSIDTFWLGIFFTLPVLVFVTHTFFTTKYSIQHNILGIKSGLLVNKNIPIKSITKIEDTTSILSSPAASIAGRIEIRYNKYDIVIVSPKDKQGFVSHLQQINPEIQVKIKREEL